MKYSLDTNTCIRAINGRVPEVRSRLLRVPAKDVVVCAIVRAELYAGASKSQTPIQTHARNNAFLLAFSSLPFDDHAVQYYGTLRSALEKSGTPIGPLDMLIAAIALAHDLILVTHNTSEFGRIAGLRLEDWELPPP